MRHVYLLLAMAPLACTTSTDPDIFGGVGGGGPLTGASSSAASSTSSISASASAVATTATASTTSGADGAAASSSGSGGDGGGGGAPWGDECVVDTDCPGVGYPCSTTPCDHGWCGYVAFPAGTLANNNVPHDCSVTVCDGMGSWTLQADLTDVPPDDGNECTLEGCDAAGPYTGVPNKGAYCDDTCTDPPCGQSDPALTDDCDDWGVCDGSGVCQVFVSVACKTPNNIYTGCNRVAPPNKITWGVPFDPATTCSGTVDRGHCPTGTPCVVHPSGGGANINGTCK